MKKLQKISCALAALCLLCVFWGMPAGAVKANFTLFHGDRTRPRIALTVDDCYDGKKVSQLLDLCEEHGVPMTFFVVGSALKLNDQALWRRALALGCEIGNHTWSHPRLHRLNRGEIRQTLSRTQEKLNKLLGFDYDMQLMRPPYGELSGEPGKKSDLWVVETIEAAGYAHAVCWDVSQTDASKALREVQNGSILLYHANPKDIRCLKKLIPALLEAGYEPVTVSELLGLPPPRWEAEKQP